MRTIDELKEADRRDLSPTRSDITEELFSRITQLEKLRDDMISQRMAYKRDYVALQEKNDQLEQELERVRGKVDGLDAEQHRLYCSIAATVSNLINKKPTLALQSARIGMYGESITDPLAVEKMEVKMAKIRHRTTLTPPQSQKEENNND